MASAGTEQCAVRTLRSLHKTAARLCLQRQLDLALEKILQYDFYIILSGLGFITSEGLLSIILGKGLPAPSTIDTPVPPLEQQNPV